MNKEEILKAFDPKQKIIIIGCVDIGSAIHRTVMEIQQLGREIVVVSNEREAAKEAGIFVREERVFELTNLDIPPPEFIFEKDKLRNRTGNPIDAIAKKRKY